MRHRATVAILLTLAVSADPALAGGPLLIDHALRYDNSGIWKRSVQKDVAVLAAATTIGGAAFLDSDTRLGRTFDQAMDAMLFTAATTTAMKYAFSRERPSQNSDPGDFFDGSGYGSFPSGEVGEISAVVTPFIAEYQRDYPAAYALALLPVYDAIARVKTHGHWQSDVLAGAAVGVGWGVYAHHRQTPFVISVLPGGGFVFGYHKSF